MCFLYSNSKRSRYHHTKSDAVFQYGTLSRNVRHCQTQSSSNSFDAVSLYHTVSHARKRYFTASYESVLILTILHYIVIRLIIVLTGSEIDSFSGTDIVDGMVSIPNGLLALISFISSSTLLVEVNSKENLASWFFLLMLIILVWFSYFVIISDIVSSWLVY